MIIIIIIIIIMIIIIIIIIIIIMILKIANSCSNSQYYVNQNIPLCYYNHFGRE